MISGTPFLFLAHSSVEMESMVTFFNSSRICCRVFWATLGMWLDTTRRLMGGLNDAQRSGANLDRRVLNASLSMRDKGMFSSHISCPSRSSISSRLTTSAVPHPEATPSLLTRISGLLLHPSACDVFNPVNVISRSFVAAPVLFRSP